MSFRYIFLLGTSLRLNGPLAERLMHIAHKIEVLKLSSDWLSDTGFPGDVCVAFRLETKMPCCQTPSWRRKPSCLQLCQMLYFQKYVKYLKFAVCYCGNISMPQHDTAQNETWLIASQSHGLLGRPWPFKAAKVPRPSVISLKVWLRETNWSSTYFCLTVCLRHQSAC